MAFLLVGLLGLPVALILYALAVRTRGWAWVPEPPGRRDGGRRLEERPAGGADGVHLMPAAGILAVVVLAVLATVRLPAVPAPSRPASPTPAAAPASAPPKQVLSPLQLPPGAPLKVTASVGRTALNDPRDVAVDAAGNLYVADDGNHRVVKLDRTGALLAVWTDTAGGKLKEPV
ncbi:MAG: hypothetical protein KGJ86_13420, partial [Chloroflexota bacterium]|nr:hypothetical protein [Chloroflexota bacterium]